MVDDKGRGFGAMTPEQRAEVARKGGKAAHAKGKAHTFTKESAKAAGSKGGKAVHAKRRERSEATPPKAES
jgi:general stress protein YciG